MMMKMLMLMMLLMMMAMMLLMMMMTRLTRNTGCSTEMMENQENIFLPRGKRKKMQKLNY